MADFIRRLLAQAGFEIRRIRPQKNDLIGFILDRDIDLILDVGANVGQFGDDLRAKGYGGRIASFEPVSAVYQVLAAKAKLDGRWDVFNCALGAASETTTINVADSSTYSSMLPTTGAAVLHDAASTAVRQERINVRKLDDVFPNLSANALLKIDTQGYERQVLEGARHVLNSIKGVLMELPIIHLYRGTWQLHEAIAFMASVGFVPAQIQPVNYHLIDRCSLLEVDCLFRPFDRRLDPAHM